MSRTQNNKSVSLEKTESKVMADAEPIVGKPAVKANVNVDANQTASAGEFDYSPKKVEGHGSSVKQETIAKAISGSGASGTGGGSTPFMSNMRSVPYSGTDARIIDNASGTPAFNKSDRSDSRYGQKTDNTARHINYVPSETYLIDTDGPSPLSESADKVQGSLGHPANEFARIQKCSEAFPGAINFERSVDEITDDCLLYTEGQQIKYSGTGESYDDIDPTQTFSVEEGKKIDYTIHRGNYIPRTLKVKYDANGNLSDYYYDEDANEVVLKGDQQVERACTHTITAANRAEIDRQAMAAKAGNEVDDSWSPIPYSYSEPTRDVLYMSTVEKQCGANILVAVKMSAKAHSYALNKAAKDGLRPTSGGVEIGLGPVFTRSESKAYDKFDFSSDSHATSIFNTKFTSKGAPSAIVKMLDSIAKYHDRGDLLTQPRSFNMILKQGLSNYKQFKIDPEFAKVFENVNVFSTIDRSYDPSAPVCITDTVALVNPYSFNELGSCFRTANVSVLRDNDLNTGADDVTPALYANKATKLVDGTVNFVVLPSQFIELDADEHIDNLVVTADIIEQAAKVVRHEGVKKFGHAFFNKNYVVPFLKYAATDAGQEGRMCALCFNFSDDPIPTTDATPDVTFTYTYLGEATTETVTVDSTSYNTAKALIYNDYLAMYYKNRQNYYYIQLRDSYTDGIKKFLRMNYGLMSKVVDSNGEIEWPIHYSTKSFSAYAYLVMMSLKYIQEQRSKSMLDVLNYEHNFGYPFTDCDDNGNYSALGGVQYGQSDIFEPLEVRQMTPVIAVRWTHPELYAKLTAADSAYRTLMPFYMNEDSYDFLGESSGTYGLSLNYERAAMSYPVTKHGVRWSYSDDLYGLSERDLRLVLDMIIAPPSFEGDDSCTAFTSAPEVYKYSQANDGLLIIPEDVTQSDLLYTARELGYICPVVGGYLFPEPCMKTSAKMDPTNPAFELDTRCNASTSIVGHSAFRAICWVIEDGTPATSILQSGSSVISRAANFSQKYYIFVTNEEHPGSAIGLCLNTSDVLSSGSAVAGISQFSPFTDGVFVAGNGGQTQLTTYSLFNYASGLWSRIQKLPFSYNPFDFGGAVETDPYSFNYLFGLLGFRSSDYKEDLYNRLTQRMADGWKFISDPLVEASLLTK